MTVRLAGFLKKGVDARAKLAGTRPSKWVAALVQSHLMRTPVLSDRELERLDAALRELFRARPQYQPDRACSK